MKVLLSVAFSAILISFVNSQTIDSLISQVFNQNGAEKTPAPNLTPIKGNFPTSAPPAPGGGPSCNGECVPYYLCSNNTIITDGVGLIDIRLMDGPCDNYLDVCCAAKDRVIEPITPPPPVVKPQGCGIRNPDGVGFRITGDKDNESQFGEFPWMVAVLREESVDNKAEKINVYQCGGALIHPRVVLTAAHCVANKKAAQLKIRAGEWDTQTKGELFPHQDRDVSEVRVHADYYAGALFNDVALLFLTSPVELADNVGLICLPQQDDNLDNSRCFASGWGKDVFGKEGNYQVILKKVELPVVPRKKCQESLRKTRLGTHFELHESFTCAGGEPGRDTCKGDGGSPLVCPLKSNPNRYVQAGIVAWGIGCGENNTPGVYVNVAKFRYWIDEEMTYQTLDTKVYQP